MANWLLTVAAVDELDYKPRNTKKSGCFEPSIGEPSLSSRFSGGDT